MIDYEYKEAKDLAEAFNELYNIIKMLRSPDGCPWDKKQTGKSAAQSLIGETYEYIDALDSNDTGEQAEEAGDMLMNVMLLLEIHRQNESFEPLDAINGVCAKLVRRHPHVFTAKAKASNEAEVLEIWNGVKKDIEGRQEHDADDFFSNIPKSTPQLEYSYQMQKKLEGIGFDWADADGVHAKVREELEEVRCAETDEQREMEIGDLLFTVINLARFYHVHPETALHKSSMKLKNRFNRLMKICAERNIELKAENVDAMNAVWDGIKESDKSSGSH